MKSYYDFLLIIRKMIDVEFNKTVVGKLVEVNLYRNGKIDDGTDLLFDGTFYWEQRKKAEKRGHMVWVERKSNRVRFK